MRACLRGRVKAIEVVIAVLGLSARTCARGTGGPRSRADGARHAEVRASAAVTTAPLADNGATTGRRGPLSAWAFLECSRGVNVRSLWSLTFDLVIGALATFPGKLPPRTLWLAVNADGKIFCSQCLLRLPAS